MIMNVKEQEKRLEEIFRKKNNEGFAVAITGCWGIGKTHFWNKFFKEKTQEEKKIKEKFYYEASRVDFASAFENKKYAYISLFGIESIQDLKNAICTKLSTNPYVKEAPKRLEFSSLLKKSLEQFKDIKVSQYGVSASAKLLENLLYAQVKDAIICFDDFERLSDKLKIQDVMGLVNQLKLERNCQVILILDESKNDEENKKKYAEYKEKLIDDTIKITSVEPLIRVKAEEAEIDQPLIDLMVKFADELEIHNFRFFQKVIKLYREFLEQLPNEVAYWTKEIILVRILQGYFIEDFGQNLDINWDQFTRKSQFSAEVKKKHDKDHIGKDNIQLNLINSISPIFSQNDLWATEFKKWFEQKSSFDSKIIRQLVESDLIDDNYMKAKAKIDQLINNYKNYNLDSGFTKKLSSEIKKIIKFDVLENIEFYCSFLSEFDAQEEINQIDQLVKEHLQSAFNENRERMLKLYYWHEDQTQKYRKFIKDLLDDPNSFKQQEFLRILELYLYKGETAYGSEEVLYHMTKKHLENFIKDEYPSAFKTLSLKTICKKIIELYQLKQSQMVQTVKSWLKEIIENIGKSKGYPQHYINYFTEEL